MSEPIVEFGGWEKVFQAAYREAIVKFRYLLPKTIYDFGGFRSVGTFL